MELGLLGPEAIKDADRQSQFQGLLATALKYAATPKNKGYGSIIPYLAEAYGTGMQAAQNPYTQLGKDMQYKKQFDDYEKKKRIEDLSSKLFTTTGATTQPGVYQANANLVPIDVTNPAGLNIAPNFNLPKQVTIPGKRTLDEDNLKKLMALDLSAGAAALTIDDKFMARDQLDASKLAIKEFTTTYPQYEYLNQQEPSIAMGTIRSIVGPSRHKIIGGRYSYDTLTKKIIDLGKDNPELIKAGQTRGTFQEKGKMLNPKSGKAYPVLLNTATGAYTVKYLGKDVPLKDFDQVAEGGKALLGEGVNPVFRNTGNLNQGQLQAKPMNDLFDSLKTSEISSQRLISYLVKNSDASTGFQKGYERIIAQGKILAGIAKQNGLTETEVLQIMSEGQFEGLAGSNRLAIVGPGAMTEQDAARLYSALGGKPGSLTTSPEAVEMLVSDILLNSYSSYTQNLEKYNIQRMSGYSNYPAKVKYELNKKQMDVIAPPVLVRLGLKEFTDLTGSQYVRYKKQDRYDFKYQMKQLPKEEAEAILKKMGIGKKKIQIQKELKGANIVNLDEKGDKKLTYREKQAEENFRSIFR
jgi:hypothetical protein